MSFPRYPKYKPSGVEWLAEVPESWEVRRIKHLGKTITGGTPKTEEPEYWTDGDVPWLPSGKVQNNSIHKEDADTFITKRALAESAAKLIRPGSALIALTGATCANAAFLTFESTANQSVVGIEPKLNADGRFIYYSLLSQREQVLTHKSGGAQGGINQEDVRNLVITAPEKAEQTAIAEFLDRETAKIDELVAEQRRLMELLKEKRQAVISHAVTKGLNPNAPMKPSGIEWLGDVPVGWDVKRLKYAMTLMPGYSFASGDFVEEGIQLIRIGNLYLNELSLDRDPVFLPSQFESVYDNFIVTTNDLLMSLTGTLGKKDYGYAVLLRSNSKYLLNQRVARLRCLNCLIPTYAEHLLQSRCYTEQIHRLPFGTKQANLSSSDVLGAVIPLPPMDEQKIICSLLETILREFDTLTAEAQRAIDLLQERRTALISAAVTGQIDVLHQPRN